MPDGVRCPAQGSGYRARRWRSRGSRRGPAGACVCASLCVCRCVAGCVCTRVCECVCVHSHTQPGPQETPGHLPSCLSTLPTPRRWVRGRWQTQLGTGGKWRSPGLFTSASDRFPASQPAPAACGPRGVSGPCGGRAADLSLETGRDGGTSKPLTPWGPGIGGCPPPALTLCSMSPRHSGGPGPTMGQLSCLCRPPQGL